MTMMGVDKPSLDNLEHYGVKGMHWGVRKDDTAGSNYLVRNAKTTAGASRISRKSQKVFLKEERARIEAGGKFAQKQFKSDVRSARAGRGLPGSRVTGTYAGKKGEETSLFTGKFYNNKGQEVSESYANAVLSQAVKQQTFKHRLAAGGAFAALILATYR